MRAFQSKQLRQCSCTLLSELHLYQNSITSVAALAENPNLSLVDLSSNQICSLDSLPALPLLQTLHLSANPLRTFEAISAIAHLPSVLQISFASPMHESCPVCFLPNYKDFVLAQLPHVTDLDGLPISGDQSQQAQQNYLDQISQLSQSLQLIEKEQRYASSSLKSQIQAQNDQLAEMHEQALDKVAQMQSDVHSWRAQLVAEVDRRKQSRQQAYS